MANAAVVDAVDVTAGVTLAATANAAVVAVPRATRLATANVLAVPTAALICVAKVAQRTTVQSAAWRGKRLAKKAAPHAATLNAALNAALPVMRNAARVARTTVALAQVVIAVRATVHHAKPI